MSNNIISPPFNNDAERAIIGGLLGNFSREALDIVKVHLIPSDFFKTSHQKIFSAICQINDKATSDGVVDLLTIKDRLESRKELQEVGGTAYLASLSSIIPSNANIEYYSKIVQENSIRRTLIETSETLQKEAHDGSEELGMMIENAEKRIFDINDKRYQGSYSNITDLASTTFDTILARKDHKSHITGVPSGFKELDERTLGFHKSEMIIIGARPSIGKTAFALSMATNMIVRAKQNCAFFTLEMPANTLVERMLASESRVDFQRIRKGLLSNADTNKLMTAVSVLYESKFFIVDIPNVPLLELRAQARRLVMKEKVEVIIIDYLGLISAENRLLPRHEQMASISRSLKSLARELDIPIIALSQVGRQVEGKEPGLADLRESGAIEQDADLVLLLHRNADRGLKPEEEDEGPKDTQLTKLIIAKNRNGPTDTVNLAFQKNIVRFEQAETQGDY